MAKLAGNGVIGVRFFSGSDHRVQFHRRALRWSDLSENQTGFRRSTKGSRCCRKVPSLGGKKSGGAVLDKNCSRNGSGCCEDEEDWDLEDSSSELSRFRGLVLDISYRPVDVVSWKRALCLEFAEKVDVLTYYDQTVSSTRGSFYIPAVLRVTDLLQVMKRRRIKHNLSRKNLLYRDNYSCQYCSSCKSLTIDHVLPVSQGGEQKWENLVIACTNCNLRKGQKTLEEANMTLIKTPKAPADYDILDIPLTSAALKSLNMCEGVPHEWLRYLSKPQH